MSGAEGDDNKTGVDTPGYGGIFVIHRLSDNVAESDGGPISVDGD